MKSHNPVILIAIAIFGTMLLGCGGESKTQQQPVSQRDFNTAAGNEGQSAPVVCVKTVAIRKGTITEHIVVYGSVIPAPGALRTVSVPYGCQILAIKVNDGQKVAEGESLLRVQPSPDTLLQLDQARNAYKLQQESFRQMKRRYELKLATNEQLLQARQSLEQAKLSLESLTNRGVDGETDIKANVSGLVKKVYVQEGSIVAAGNPLIEIVAQNRVEVLLGVEPEDIGRVQQGQTVSLKRVNAPASPEGSGKIRKLSYAVNPSTRLVDVFVTLSSAAGFLLGESIAGKIPITSSEGLIVPRSAVLPEDSRHLVFSVKNGKAVEHSVAIGVETAKEYQIVGKDLHAGELVIVEGNYELADGMQVNPGNCQ